MGKLDKKYGKMAFDDEINETGEELKIDDIEFNLVNKLILKPE